MARLKAVLILDEHRYDEQLTYVRERAPILLDEGLSLWASITQAQVTRFAEAGIIVQVDEDADFIETPAVRFNPLEIVPAPAPELRRSEPTGADRAPYIVQFIAPPRMAWLDDIVAAGGILLQDLPINALIVQMTAGQAATVRALEFVQWVGLYHPGYAVAAFLGGREDLYPIDQLIQLTAARVGQYAGAYALHPFDEYDSALLETALADLGIVIPEDEQGDLPIKVEADASNIGAVLQLAGLYAIEPYIQATTSNARAGIITGIEEVRSFGMTDFLINLDGSGEIVGVVDTGIDPTHPDFGTNPASANNRVIFIGNVHDFSVPTTRPTTEFNLADMHGIHVAGTIAGNGAAPITTGAQIRGVAPNTQLIFHSVRRSPTSGSNFPAMSRMIRGMNVAHLRGARVHSNSWGGEYSDGVHRYDGDSRRMDTWAFTHPDSLVLFAVGNQNQDGTSMGMEAAAKNVIAVGASENVNNTEGRIVAPATMDVDSDNADHIWQHSSRGTVRGSRGRIRPDIVAPGSNIISVGQQSLLPATINTEIPKSADPNFYVVFSGTSMATPHVSGAALLTRQFLRVRYDQLRRPSQFLGFPTSTGLNFGAWPLLVRTPTRLLAIWELFPNPADPHVIQVIAASPDLTLQTATPTNIVADYAQNPMPQAAAHGEALLFVHAATNDELHLRRLQADFSLDNGFGTSGVVTVANDMTQDVTKSPSVLVVGNVVAVAWVNASDNLRFQRFNADTGAAIDNASLELGAVFSTTPQPYITHTGTHYALMWTQVTAQGRSLVIRTIAENGTVQAQHTLATATLLDYSYLWIPESDLFLIAYSADEVLSLTVATADGTPIASSLSLLSLPTTTQIKMIRILVREQGGYYIIWQDTSQDTAGTPDVYMTILDQVGNVIIPADASAGNRQVLRLTDTASGSKGFAAFSHSNGVTVLWQAEDEVNSDQQGVYGLNVTPQGAFAGQVDPRTPLIANGHYINQTLRSFTPQEDDRFRDRVALACTGGHEYLMRLLPDPILPFTMAWELVQTDADSRVVSAFGFNGAQQLGQQVIYALFDLHWTGAQGFLASIIMGAIQNPQLRLWNAEGQPVTTFGTNGVVDVEDAIRPTNSITAQVTHYVIGNRLRIVGVYGTTDDIIRYTSVDATGATVTEPRDLLTDVAGTARTGWFHSIQREARHIAAWQRVEGAETHIFVNRFRWDGTRIGGDVRVTEGLGGQSINAVLAPRPTAMRANNREYGLAYQHRADDTVPWEIHFSRLSRTARVVDRPAAAFPNVDTSDHTVIAAGVSLSGDGNNPWPADHQALEPQLICTFLHEEWNHPHAVGNRYPDWSPGYGLAFIGVDSGGKRTLYFTGLDENGRRLRPDTFGNPPVDVPILAISERNASVIDFQLAWNGRTFRLAWTEKVGAEVRHRHTAVTRYASRRIHEIPSAVLLRAMLINGATNLQNQSLPQVGPQRARNQAPTDGYGWGRLNLRQALSPIPPVTMHVRDDNALASGQRARYTFFIPHNTALLRCTVVWLDPPRARLVNTLQLRMRAPGQAAGMTFRGNTWDTTAGQLHLSREVPIGDAQNIVENTQQIVLANPASGEYEVEVIATLNATNTFNQNDLLHYALVFVGSGQEIRMTNPNNPLPNRVY